MSDRGAHDLKPGISVPVFSGDVAWDSRAPRPKPQPRDVAALLARGSDRSDMSQANHISLRLGISQGLDRKIGREASKRQMSKAELVRRLLDYAFRTTP